MNSVEEAKRIKDTSRPYKIEKEANGKYTVWRLDKRKGFYRCVFSSDSERRAEEYASSIK